MVYIRTHQLPKLKEYKYNGVDHSLVSRYVMKPFYTNYVIDLFPMSMAPNAITLSGFGFIIINFLTLMWYNPTLDQECPRWVYASWAVGLFLYQTFDAVDGSQARRTKQSGPLGELFDHGVDAINTSIVCLIFCGAMNLGQSWKAVLIVFASLFTFYVQTWDEYHTKTLTLGIISGPVEGILTLVAVFFFTAIKGPNFWHTSLLGSLGVSPGGWASSGVGEMLYGMIWIDWYMVYGGLVLLFSTYTSILNVLQARTSRGENSAEALMGLVPFAVTWTLVPSYLLLFPNVLHHHLIPFIFFCGLTNAYSVGQMIIAHLTLQKFPYYNVLNLPLSIAVIDGAGRAAGLWTGVISEEIEVGYLYGCLGLAIGVYGTFVIDVIVAICDYLDIWCLTIKHPVPIEGNKSGGMETKKVA